MYATLNCNFLPNEFICDGAKLNYLRSQIIPAIVAASITAIIGWIAISASWIRTIIIERYIYEISREVFEHIDITPKRYEGFPIVDGRCEKGEILLSASCSSRKTQNNRYEPAGGPIIGNSFEVFTCNAAGDTNQVVATAICMKPKQK